MRKLSAALALAVVALGLALLPALAQAYSFSVPEEIVDVYLESDGTMRVVYHITFQNNPGASPIDFVDVGVPTSDYDLSSVQAWIDGQPLDAIEDSPYVHPGIAVGLGSRAIPSGGRGEVVVDIARIGQVLYAGDQAGFASAKFSPSWFDSSFVTGSTDLTVTFHLPPGIQPDQPRWHVPSGGWPSGDPATGIDRDGRIVYSWRNTNANAYTQYTFGASFPSSVVPQGSLQSPLSDLIASVLAFFGAVGSCLLPALPVAIFIALIVFAQQRRKLAYLPPRISIEGHGIKRGLTAVEAAVLLQTPLDKVLTMILFGVIRKGAGRVVKEEPLQIEALPDAKVELREYEAAFLKASVLIDKREKQRAFTTLMIELVRSVQRKMKGFSLRETRDYYKSIMRKAWTQIEAAGTPEVKSEKFAEGLEWLMLDGDFTGRTQRTFESGPVYVPMWWGSYSPSRPATAAPVAAAPAPATGKSISLPHLPGSDFAASIARGVQNSASSLVGNVSAFTAGIARTTNPPPVTRSYGGGSHGGGGCACACACAGCACACAGGGR